ncbi:polysaccharide pyruvyl transferase family protein [Aliivibrio fischeri]|uniref:polysaccharide pyruvyl transferase family protein n=1 Tax=Aliivibrio fischeri TaxID=668 RepID=UPI001F3AD754|nr:polysaccharide pyruvyl transferase family protein [Aliivibrio fischeri]MCE7556846.1 polysaccharide pyruvyl transferase family protein [Aliivibrio fischeri]MCE7563304.1 polysaccharide pyruvyl transferase family protein [Aliivibrio fischeri]MCE7570275.1 polysaccharide pyruvyl transferase family protein [Aliivibrio fischeri]
MKFVLAGNSSYGNRGCEAIVRGSLEVLKSSFNIESVIAHSNFKSIEEYNWQVNFDNDKSIIHKPAIFPDRYSLPWFEKQAYKIISPERARAYTYKNIIQDIKNSDCTLSIGGDNYSLDYGRPTLFTDLNNTVLSNRKPVIIWGASVGPFTKDVEYERFMSKHLKKVTAIFARETMTVEYLDSIGINENVHLVADPAFVMQPDYKYKDKFKDYEVGLNISPLMKHYWSLDSEEEFHELITSTINKIINKINGKLLLIPHVIQNHSNDLLLLENVYNKLPLDVKERVTLLNDDYNAEQLKGIISGLRLFIGARTHATIAAFSSNVPTISLAYSLKAEGLNKDIFGHKDFCIKPSDYNIEYLGEVISSVLESRNEISESMIPKIEEIKMRSLSAGKLLKQII